MSTRHTHDDAATSTDAASMGAPITGPLSRREREALLVCEATIDEHLGAWVNVTNAIAEIANRRLYRETHPTFEAYLRDRWGLSRSQGHRLVLAARVAMSPVGDTIRNERQAVRSPDCSTTPSCCPGSSSEQRRSAATGR